MTILCSLRKVCKYTFHLKQGGVIGPGIYIHHVHCMHNVDLYYYVAQIVIQCNITLMHGWS